MVEWLKTMGFLREKPIRPPLIASDEADEDENMRIRVLWREKERKISLQLWIVLAEKDYVIILNAPGF